MSIRYQLLIKSASRTALNEVLQRASPVRRGRKWGATASGHRRRPGQSAVIAAWPIPQPPLWRRTCVRRCGFRPRPGERAGAASARARRHHGNRLGHRLCGVQYFDFRTSSDHGRRDFTTRLKTPEAHFDTRRVRWSHWVCVDLLPAEIRNRADEVFRSHGLRRLTDAPGMIAPRLLPPSRPLPPILWRRVQDTESRLAFAHITWHSFEIPFETCRTSIEPEPAWRGSYRGYVGFEQGQPVCTAAIVVAAGVIGIYSVGTLPGYRRRGLAEALLRAVLADVSSETGMSRFALQSTRAGYHLYRRMGFEDVGRFAVYLT